MKHRSVHRSKGPTLGGSAGANILCCRFENVGGRNMAGQGIKKIPGARKIALPNFISPQLAVRRDREATACRTRIKTGRVSHRRVSRSAEH